MSNTTCCEHDCIRAIRWQDDALLLLDQRLLPARIDYLCLHDVDEVVHAISAMVVRGAPAIGIAAAYGVVLAARAHYRHQPACWQTGLRQALARLATARPTAVNLIWALRRMEQVFTDLQGDPEAPLLAEARAIHEQDIAANQRMGELGAALLRESPGTVLTHCNTGSLATGGYGTALGVIRSGFTAGLIDKVYAGETRPWLQGARLTAWELIQDGIPVTLLADSAASHLFRQGDVRWVIVGADRITANGDVANKIGTYNLAVSARYHGVRFMVVAPTSTIDISLANGSAIPIEQRGSEELLTLSGQPIAAVGAAAWNPVFDVTPADLIDALVTERGVVLQPNVVNILHLLEGSQ